MLVTPRELGVVRFYDPQLESGHMSVAGRRVWFKRADVCGGEPREGAVVHVWLNDDHYPVWVELDG